jgi:hypothetical protein
MLNGRWKAGVLPAQRDLAGDLFNIIVVFLSRLHGVVFRDLTGGIDGQEGVVPGGVRAVGAVCGGVRVVAVVTVVFVFGDGRQAVPAGSAQPLA